MRRLELKRAMKEGEGIIWYFGDLFKMNSFTIGRVVTALFSVSLGFFLYNQRSHLNPIVGWMCATELAKKYFDLNKSMVAAEERDQVKFSQTGGSQQIQAVSLSHQRRTMQPGRSSHSLCLRNSMSFDFVFTLLNIYYDMDNVNIDKS